MRLLLDECLPRRLARVLSDHEVITVPQAGWAGLKNGELLRLAMQAGFEAFVTVDHGIRYQQNLAESSLRIIALRARSNRFDDLALLTPDILSALAEMSPGEFRILGA